MLGQVIDLIERHQRFAITTHIRPDGADEICVAPDLEHDYDAIFVIECSDVERPGLPSLADKFVVNIDHHSTTALYGDINWIDSTAAAVGEMVYNLAKAIGAKITPEIASCVYAALLTDTGSFHFSNTTERTFKIASELVRHGAQPAKLSQAIFYNYPYAKVSLVGEVLSTLQRDESGRIAWIKMTKDAMERSGATEDDSDGIINYPLTIGEVEAVAFFRELPNDTFRISLRSKNRVNVARVAEHFGGGGHSNAAGFTIKANFEELSRQVLAELKEAVRNAPPAVNGCAREIKPR
jgi:bifunctional oligoribonuclease and PAP phosphatase NrnA